MTATKLRSLVCAGAISLALTTTARADEEVYKPQIVPECKVYPTTLGPVCGYADLEDVKKLYTADAELVLLREENALLRTKVVELGGQLANLRLALDSQGRALGIVEQRGRELTKQLLEQNRKYELERVKPRWGTGLSWGVALLAGALLVGYVAADQL